MPAIYEQRQQVMTWIIKDLLRIVLERRAVVDKRIESNAVIEVHAFDVSAKDNNELASAGNGIKAVALDLLDRELIDSVEVLRLIYKYIGENQ